VLAEVPELELAQLLERLREVDRLLAGALDDLLLLQDSCLAETATGAPLERWLAVVARRTGADRRMLATAARACRRLPTLHAAFGEGRVSWAQVRAVALAVERVPGHLDDAVDAEIAEVLLASDGDGPPAEPDDLVRAIGWALTALAPDEAGARSTGPAPEADWLAMQPRLDGSGGQVHGDFGPEGFAILDATLNDGLPGPSGPVKNGPGSDPDPVRARAAGREAARHRATRLLRLCATGGQRTAIDEADDEDAPVTGLPNLSVRAELSTLLGDDGLPADLLTRFTGGVLHVDAATARRLMDRYGTRLRLILVDHGRGVGVGRTSRQPPEWLAETVTALHDTCSEPGCRTPARRCDVDHARPWVDGGRTDLDNLAPVCSTTNHRKEEAGWRVHQAPDGVRIWLHPRSGLSTRTLPARWRPPPQPTGTDPPDP
jgi:hypothetical protein